MASPTNNNGGMISRLAEWTKSPFNEQQGLLAWFLFVGLLMVFVIIWRKVLKDITEI